MSGQLLKEALLGGRVCQRKIARRYRSSLLICSQRSKPPNRIRTSLDNFAHHSFTGASQAEPARLSQLRFRVCPTLVQVTYLVDAPTGFGAKCIGSMDVPRITGSEFQVV